MCEFKFRNQSTQTQRMNNHATTSKTEKPKVVSAELCIQFQEDVRHPPQAQLRDEKFLRWRPGGDPIKSTHAKRHEAFT